MAESGDSSLTVKMSLIRFPFSLSPSVLLLLLLRMAETDRLKRGMKIFTKCQTELFCIESRSGKY